MCARQRLEGQEAGMQVDRQREGVDRPKEAEKTNKAAAKPELGNSGHYPQKDCVSLHGSLQDPSLRHPGPEERGVSGSDWDQGLGSSKHCTQAARPSPLGSQKLISAFSLRHSRHPLLCLAK